MATTNLKENGLKIAGISAASVGALLAQGAYITVDSNSGMPSVDPSLATDIKTQLVTGAVQASDLILTVFVGLIAIAMVIAAIYFIVKWIRRKTG